MLIKMRVIFVAVAVACLNIVMAQVPFTRRCPVVKVMNTFDIEAYMGIWYEYAKYPFIFEIGKKCMFARYDNLGNNTIGVTNAAINRITGVSSNITGKARILAPGQLAVMFSPRHKGDKANYLVLGTDYTSYAVVYVCSNLSTIAHTKIVWILTRERKPSIETVNAAKQIMDDNQLSQSFLMETKQDNCTNDPTTIPNVLINVNVPVAPTADSEKIPDAVETITETMSESAETNTNNDPVNSINIRAGNSLSLDKDEAEHLDMLNRI